MSDYVGLMNLTIAVFCLLVIVAATARTETRLLRYVMVCVLLLEAADRATVGYLRLASPGPDFLSMVDDFLGLIRTLLALCILGLALAIFSLDRTDEKEP